MDQVEVLPFYQHFTIHDPDYDDEIDNAAASARSVREVVGGNGELIFIRCAQPTIPVTVTVAYHGRPAPSPGDQWTATDPQRLRCPTAELAVDQVETGYVLTTRLLRGPGDYVVTVYHQGRDAVLEAQAAQPRAADETVDDLIRAADALAGIEQYLIHIWPAD